MRIERHGLRALYLASLSLVACTALRLPGSPRESGNWSAGTAAHEVPVAGMSRSFLLHVPANAPRTMIGLRAKFPLVIALHGSNGTSEDIRRASRFDSIAEARRFLVAYPQGSKGVLGLAPSDWNVGTCCGAAHQENLDDVGFILGVIARVSEHVSVDPGRIYVAGFSDGGRMAYHLACQAAGRIAAIGVVAGSLLDAQCSPDRPMPVIAFHGTADTQVAYDEMALTRVSRDVPAWGRNLTPSIRFWSAHDGCRDAVARGISAHVVRTVIAPCDGSDLALYTIDGGVHGWPGEAGGGGAAPRMSEIDASDLMIRFFLDHSR